MYLVAQLNIWIQICTGRTLTKLGGVASIDNMAGI